MSKQRLKEIIHGRVHIQIGKNGISSGVVEQIKNRFKNNSFLKIRFLELYPYDDMDQATKLLAEQVNAKIMDIRGNTCVLKKLREN